jgi:hypothetical protein
VFRERTATSDRCSSARAEPPEGIHPDAGSQASLPTPASATPAEIELGGRIFHGQVASAPCEGCHGTDARALPKGRVSPAAGGCGAMAACIHYPDDRQWGAETEGIRTPDASMAGAQLSQSELAAVSAYVWALGHRTAH